MIHEVQNCIRNTQFLRKTTSLSFGLNLNFEISKFITIIDSEIKKQMKRLLIVILTWANLIACSDIKLTDEGDSSLGSIPNVLWYEQPANNWMQEALPIGNGYLGAMFFGGIEEERIQFNEESLWSGGNGEWDEYNGGNRPGAHKHLSAVRALLKEGKYQEAHTLANKELTGVIKANKGNSIWEGFGAYQSFGDLYIHTRQDKEITNYRRSLNIEQSIAEVSYRAGTVNHKRRYFASYPKRVLVFQFENDAAGGTIYEIKLTSLHENRTIRLEDNILIMRGALENNGMAFESRMLIESGNSDISFEKGTLIISSAKMVTLYLTAATDYLNVYPEYKGRDYEKLNQETIAKVSASNFQEIHKEHISDYQSLFSRASLRLGKAGTTQMPTDKRLEVYQTGAEDPALEALYFQYGRYLLISSSRPGSLPANLQGKWNHINNPPWASDYHANINIQMIYWPAEVTNLAEVHKPLIEYIDRLRAPGRQSAKDFFNARGWIVNSMNNVFGFTAPGWDFPWGFFPAGAAWYGQHIWQHYEFNPDEDYLRNKAYPIMKEAALFWLDYLTVDEQGFLVSSPSYSPEHGGISTGAYMDVEIAWDLFNNTIKALNVLEVDPEFKKELIKAKENLVPLRIGRWGQLQEWKEDLDDPENKHRHLSHLYALHPGNQINMIETPELAEAARTSLIARGNQGTGWSIAWKINFWARLKDAKESYAMLRRALKLSGDTGYNMVDGGGVYPNLLSTHPPFQLDGNMGLTAGMAEMLLQSHAGVIELLPALPEVWSEGDVKGLKARGGVEVDISWKDGKLTKTKIRTTQSGRYSIKYLDLRKVLDVTEEGQEFILNAIDLN